MAGVRVVLVTGTGRSGSTLLGNLLGEQPGWFAAGEVRYLWERGLIEHRTCGCGATAEACPVWSPVIADLAANRDDASPATVVPALRRSQRLRHLPVALLAPALHRRRLGALPAILGDLYSSIARAANAEVVVDTSKLPLYGAALAAAPGIDLSIVHLVRSPHATAHSWTRRKATADGGPRLEMERRGVAKSTSLWVVWNWATERLFRRLPYARIRYEDLIARPKDVLTDVVARLGGEPGDLGFVADGEARLSPNHMIAGNPDRLRSGTVPLRLDDRWESELDAGAHRIVSALALPRAARYGYARTGHPV